MELTTSHDPFERAPLPPDMLQQAEAVFNQHCRAVRAYVWKRVPFDLMRLLDADDIVQDVGLEFFRRCADVNLDDPDHVRRMLLTVARHRIIDLIRELRSQKRGGSRLRLDELAASDGGEPLVSLLEQLAVYERTPSQSAIDHELAEHVQRTIERLPPDYARCIRIRHIEQRSVKEAAGLMQRSEHAIHMLSCRAMAQLKVELLKSARSV